jgi:hypothetical protein
VSEPLPAIARGDLDLADAMRRKALKIDKRLGRPACPVSIDGLPKSRPSERLGGLPSVVFAARIDLVAPSARGDR